MYQVTDNQDDPVTWSTPQVVDEGTGTECFGIGTILDKKSQQTNRGFLADRAGLIIFEGYVKKPEASWLVENSWSRINKAVFNLVQIVVNVENSSFYVALPLDGATSITHILYGYFGDAYGPYGFDPKMIKYSLWTMSPGVRCITSDIDTDGTAVLFYSGSPDNIYKLGHDQSVHNDDGSSFQSFIQTALYTSKPKWTQHCNLIGFRLIGNGTLKTTLSGQDGVDSLALPDKVMSPTPGRDMEMKTNFQSTRISIKILTGISINEYFRVSRMDLYLKPMWLSFPG